MDMEAILDDAMSKVQTHIPLLPEILFSLGQAVAHKMYRVSLI